MIQTYRNPNFFGNDFITIGVESLRFDSVYAHQRRSNHCWAASIQMAANLHGLNISQTSIASDQCGVDAWGQPNNCPASLDVISSYLNRCYRTHCVTARPQFGSPTPTQLFNLLKSNYPVIIAYDTGGDIGHAVLITGITLERTMFGDEARYISVRDPDPSLTNRQRLGKIVYNAESLLQRIYAYWVPIVTKYHTCCSGNSGTIHW